MADRFVNPATLAATEKYLEIAKDAGMAPVTLATAWSMNFDFVASTIIGARTAAQLEDSLAALDVTLTDEIMQQCDEVHKQFPYPMG
jgi:aryl-alcohol dehydrogenase-like predicted oxidoreductase